LFHATQLSVNVIISDMYSLFLSLTVMFFYQVAWSSIETSYGKTWLRKHRSATDTQTPVDKNKIEEHIATILILAI